MAEKSKDRFALSRNFLATDETPDTLFGIPVVADRSQYTPEDLAFFRKHPEAGGYYDMGDEEEVPEESPMQAASKAGDTWTWETYRWNPEAKGGRKIDPKNIKGTGVSFDAAKERLRVPEGREAEFEGWMDSLASLPSTIKVNGRSVPIKSFLVPKDWRTNTEYNKDYDYVAAFLADAKPGPLDHGPKEGWFWHMGDAGKMPTHPTFSRESYYARDPRYSDLAGDWEGETYLPGKAERAVRQDNNGGKAKKKIPPIVKGPIHYGPPPPPSRGKYPGISNNPGNVEKHERRSDKTLFKGEIAGGVRPKRFANFSDPVDGLVAAATVLSRRATGLAAKGLPFTIENYVPGYAPKSENDVEGYIKNLSRYSGFARDAVLDTGNADDMVKLLKNVVRFESGVPNSEWFTDEEYRRAARAMNPSPESAPSLPATPDMSASGGSTQTYKVGNP